MTMNEAMTLQDRVKFALRDAGFDLDEAARIAALAHPRPTGDGMVFVAVGDANNYCRILTALGMEEEGDPVAEVEHLMGIAEASPTVEQAAEAMPYTAEVIAEVVRGDDGENKLSFVIEGTADALEVGEVLYTIGGLPPPDDGAVELHLAQPRPAGVPEFPDLENCLQVTRCCGRTECGGECGNEWSGMVVRPVGVPDGWQDIATAPNDGTPHVRGLHVYGPDGKYLYWEQVAGHIDTEDGAFYSEGDICGWDANDFSHWHPLAAAPEVPRG
ncbi:MAG: hypothetical protein AAGC76_09705 [Luteibacter sp.]|uniref:hypothetical protein n=1 Tax=Luteibacter sp. TaxID=1886636 RepID=UPI0028089A85|nr:hypothetical protein [Luteibacter sp.]MDQ7996116.1 hypothetical protein [Luteibacter sp.]